MASQSARICATGVSGPAAVHALDTLNHEVKRRRTSILLTDMRHPTRRVPCRQDSRRLSGR